MMTIMKKVGNFTLSRGPRPINPNDFTATGAQTVINLEEGFFEFIHGRNGEESLWGEEFGIDVVHLPCSDIWAPSPEQVERFFRLVENSIKNGNVYFHCLHGVDRTGFMAAAYRIRYQNWRKETAISEMYQMGFHKFPYFWWADRLRKMFP